MPFTKDLKVTEITGLMGRWQLLKTEPKIFVILHITHGIKYVIERLLSEEFKRLHIVFGMANDKDTESVLRLLPKMQIITSPKLPFKELLMKLN